MSILIISMLWIRNVINATLERDRLHSWPRVGTEEKGIGYKRI